MRRWLEKIRQHLNKEFLIFGPLTPEQKQRILNAIAAAYNAKSE